MGCSPCEADLLIAPFSPFPVEFGRTKCAEYQQLFLQPLIQYVSDKSPEVRQAAVYGCGALAMYGGDQFAVTCAQIVPRLIEVVAAPNSRDPENAFPTENAISAITKILKFNSSALTNADEILNMW